jgi:acyl-CoA synthetase (AMP-forming)/AMP-acid ligase II
MLLLQDLIDWHALQDGSAEAVRDGRGASLNRGELQDAANGFAGAIQAAGLERGSRVAVLSKNCVSYLAMYLGAAKAGVVLVPLNFRLVPSEWAYIVNDAGAELLVAGPEYVDDVEAHRDEIKTVGAFVTLGAETPEGWKAFDSWIAGPRAAFVPPTIDPTDDVIQMYTSGTTGLPKGTLITHDAMTSVMAQMAGLFVGMEQKKMLVVGPIYHIAASLSALWKLSTGASFVMYDDFVPAEIVRALDEDGIGHTFLAVAMIQALLTTVPDVATRSYENLELIAYGSSPISEETLRSAMEVFGCGFGQGFGQTETCGGISYLTPAHHQRALTEKPELLRSCGRTIPGTEVKVVDPDGTSLAPFESGEIVMRGPQMMRGYWNLPEATAETLKDGWLHTGDVGYLDEEGFVYLKDRLKDVIITGGENVYPAEVEQSLFAHPAVADAAVIGIPDERWGEAVHAVVQLREGSQATEQDIIDFCKERMAGYKRPSGVTFVDALPRNASMKVLKRELRATFWEGTDRGVN